MRQFKWGRLIPGLGTAAVLVAFLAFVPEARAESCYEEAVADVEIFTPDFEAPLSGESRLCVADNGLKGDMRVEGVTPGYAYTVWWIYIDQPGGCQGFLGCLYTFFGDDPLLVLGRMDSGIGPKNGKMKFSDRLDDMVVSSGSQVWLLMFGHQAADLNDRRQLARQLLTPEDPGAGFPHLGVSARGYPAAVAIYELP